ncbi:sigma 54-interacting transcriptional regulator [Fundidesulfovibrio terrae]|uniref:sigma 54-interacting transcriptional regulator n=1 Tax=Fundidesulfovibrio terrae TaxID=2922866 RepID=UPI001FAF712C|nr:sigma 54-interacting transcriptional regulator [Fundidesulfovibrio terrae]
MHDHTPAPPEHDEAPALASLPDWFVSREVIPLDDQVALVVCHQAMHEIVGVCRDLAESPAPVLLTGETGVGKSLLARFIHASRDPYAPFVSVTTAGLEAPVLLGTLFGEGPARSAGQPLEAQAAGGTLVLEEMGDMPSGVQERLLRAWDQPAQDSPAQWICTTNLPRRVLDAPGTMIPGFLDRFRRIHVPPLRERRQDIPAIVAYFSRLKSSREASLESLEDLAKRLARHEFPGNVRELESIVSLDAGGLSWEWRTDGPHSGFCVGTSGKKGRKGARNTSR